MDVGTLTRKMDAGRLSALDHLTRLCVARIKERNLRLHAVGTAAGRASWPALKPPTRQEPTEEKWPAARHPVLIKERSTSPGWKRCIWFALLLWRIGFVLRVLPLVQRLEAARAHHAAPRTWLRFAMGSWGTNGESAAPISAHGVARRLVCHGGSSGGSAVACRGRPRTCHRIRYRRLNTHSGNIAGSLASSQAVASFQQGVAPLARHSTQSDHLETRSRICASPAKS